MLPQSMTNAKLSHNKNMTVFVVVSALVGILGLMCYQGQANEGENTKE